MAAARRTTPAPDPVVARLAEGHYDRALEDLQRQIDAAVAVLRQAHEALRRENTLVS